MQIRVANIGLATIVALLLGCASTSFDRVDHNFESTLLSPLTKSPGTWQWSGLKLSATGNLKTIANLPSWDGFIERLEALGPASRITFKNGRTARVRNQEHDWLWEKQSVLVFSYDEGDLTASLSWYLLDGTWKCHSFTVDSFVSTKTEPAESADELEQEVSRLISGSNVTLRREIHKVHRMVAIYVEQNRESEAIQLLRRATAVDASDLESQVLLAELLFRKKQVAEALEMAERVYAVVESDQLIERLEKLKPSLRDSTGTNMAWNAFGADPNGPRLVLIPAGVVPGMIHREFGDKLNQLLKIPVSLVDAGLLLESPERDSGGEWLDSRYRRLISRLSMEQRVLLGLDFDLSPEGTPSDQQKVQAIDAIITRQGGETANAIGVFHQELERMRKRSQYDGQRIITEAKKAYVAQPGELVIVVSAGDIFGDTANFLFSTTSRPYACMSNARYFGAFTDSPEYRPRLMKRMLKTGAWAAFSAAALPSCSTPYCMRTYVHSLDEEDRNENDLCPSCRDIWAQYTNIPSSH